MNENYINRLENQIRNLQEKEFEITKLKDWMNNQELVNELNDLELKEEILLQQLVKELE